MAKKRTKISNTRAQLFVLLMTPFIAVAFVICISSNLTRTSNLMARREEHEKSVFSIKFNFVPGPSLLLKWRAKNDHFRPDILKADMALGTRLHLIASFD